MNVFFINLINRPDRLSIFLKNCKSESIIPKRIEAVNGWTLDRKECNTIMYDSRSLGRGEIGCYLSHYKCYEKKIKNKDMIIFEDDAKPCEHFWWKLHEAKKNIPDDWDVILLGTTTNYHKKYRHLGKFEKINEYCYKVNSDVYGLQGYVVNDKACEDLMDCKYPIDSPIDVKITNMGLNVYLLTEWLVDAIKLGSDTQNKYNKKYESKKILFN